MIKNNKLKTILITGFSGDIGGNIAEYFFLKGFNIYGVYNSNHSQAKINIEKINKLKTENCLLNTIVAKQADLTNETSASECVLECVNIFNQIDILINAHGVAFQKLFIDTDANELKEIFNSNVISVFNITKPCIKQMISQNQGHIVNISSIWGRYAACMESIYAMSKSAIDSLTKTLAQEYSSSNIKVNAVAPGYINTKINDCYSTQDKEELLKQIPLNKFGLPQDISEAVDFLINSNYITGEIISINGGWKL